jgi:hypothetical protein
MALLRAVFFQMLDLNNGCSYGPKECRFGHYTTAAIDARGNGDVMRHGCGGGRVRTREGCEGVVVRCERCSDATTLDQKNMTEHSCWCASSYERVMLPALRSCRRGTTRSHHTHTAMHDDSRGVSVQARKSVTGRARQGRLR